MAFVADRIRWSGRVIRHLPHLLRRTVSKAWHDRILGLSAEAAFWQLISLPSLFIAVVASLGYVTRWTGGDPEDLTARLEDGFRRAFSEDFVTDTIGPALDDILDNGRADLVSLGFVIALWAGSSAMATFVNTITIAYNMRDLRGAVHSRILALWLFIGSVVLGVILLPLLVLGPDIARDYFPEGIRDEADRIISDAYYPGVILIILIGLTTLYHLAPPRRLPWRRGIPGAMLAMLIFMLGSALLRWYIRFITEQQVNAYGTLAAPIAALLFFFVLALGVLLGAEFNSAVEEKSPTPKKKPKVLDPKTWQSLEEAEAKEAEEAEAETARTERRALRPRQRPAS